MKKTEEEKREQVRKWQKDNADYVKAKAFENKKKRLAQHKVWHASNPDKKRQYAMKKYWLKKAYGITVIQKEQMMIAQGNCCAICCAFIDKMYNFCVDHNHSTGKVRQLLCRKCNIGLGHFNEDSLLLEKAINYLKKWNFVRQPQGD